MTVSHDMGRYKYKYLGYYETQQEALIALAEYNRDPYSIEDCNITLKEIMERFMADKKTKVKDATYRLYTISFNLFEPLHNEKLKALTLAKLQFFFDNCGRPYEMMYRMKQHLAQVLDYAAKFELVERNNARNIDVEKHAENVTRHEKVIFTAEEIDLLWRLSERDRDAMVIIVMLYTGLRAMEIRQLKWEDVDLEQRCFYVRQSKTAAGVRTVPIALKLVPVFERLKNGGAYVASGTDAPMDDSRFRTVVFAREMKKIDADHTCHETRHTFISMLADKGIDERVIRAIVGHSGKTITEEVYTHIGLEQKLAAVDIL